MGSTRYLTAMGELSRKDNSLCFRRDGKNVYIPVENVKEIYCLNEITLNSKLLNFLNQKQIVVHFFNYHEGYCGTFYPKDYYNSGRLLIGQVRTFENRRMEVARAIVLGIGVNMAEVLYHYYKHEKHEVKDTVDWLKKEFPERVQGAQTPTELMTFEGEAWMRFYETFGYFLPEDFTVKNKPDGLFFTGLFVPERHK